jgi:putative transposase
MKLRYRYRIYPTPSQEQQMKSVGGAVRYLYNYFLKVNIDEYQATKKFVWYNQMATELVDLKKQHTWLTETYSQVLQQSIRDLDTALKNMKKTGAGFPKFKSKYTTPVSFRYQQHVVVDNNTLYLPKIGDIKLVLHRALPPFKGMTVTQTPGGWYASLVVDVQEQQLVNHIINPVGVDVNSKFTALSTGELIANPKPLARKSQHIKNGGHQQWSLDHAGQDLPQVPVDVMADIFTHWGEMSSSTIKQEAVGLKTNSSSLVFLYACLLG